MSRRQTLLSNVDFREARPGSRLFSPRKGIIRVSQTPELRASDSYRWRCTAKQPQALSAQLSENWTSFFFFFFKYDSDIINCNQINYNSMILVIILTSFTELMSSCICCNLRKCQGSRFFLRFRITLSHNFSQARNRKRALARSSTYFCQRLRHQART